MTSRTTDLLTKNAERLLDAMADGIFITDAVGTTLKVNRMYEQLTGIKLSEVKGKNVRTLQEEGIFDHIINPEIVRTRGSATKVQHLRDGKKVILSGFPVFDEQGQLCLVVTFVRDITMLTQLNEQMTEQTALINRVHEQLAYVAHKEAVGATPIYKSPVIGEIITLISRLAQTDATILILGETGVGKDVFARYIHDHSLRRDKLMLKVDCGGISETLTESEMFGYMPGAFTGAAPKGKAGYFEMADESTVFLDELGELPLTMQTRLLRVLQDGEILRVGSTMPKKVDVRIIAATNRNLAESVEQGTFRRDLYYRLNVATIHIPPLRERQEDIPLLAEHFLHEFTTKYKKSMAFMDVTMDILCRYAWPGNVRELQNLVHSLVVTRNTSLFSPHDLPTHISGQHNSASYYGDDIFTTKRPLKDIMADIERDFLQRALEMHGSVQKVAALFQVNRSTIFRKLHENNPIKHHTDSEKTS